MGLMMSDHRLEIVYADHRDNRMILLGGAVSPDIETQDQEFGRLPEVESSDFIIDYYDAGGIITQDKYVSRETVEALMKTPVDELIEVGRQYEDGKASRLREHLTRKVQSQ